MPHSRSRRLIAVAVVAASIAATAGAEVRWVPVVAQKPGANGSYWSTELWVSNLGTSVGTYTVTFLPSGRDNTEQLLEDGTPTAIGPGQTVHLNDVVPPRSSGALRVVTSSNVIVQCRLFNTVGRGSVGQMIPAFTPEELIRTGASGHLVPLLRSPRFRTNIGLFNPSSTPITVRTLLLDADGTEVGRADYPLEPGSQTQINDILLAFKVERADAHQAVLSAEAPFAAYASIVDTRTGAPTLVVPVVR